MSRSMWILAIVASTGLAAHADEAELSGKPKSAIATSALVGAPLTARVLASSAAAAEGPAPFAGARDPLPALAPSAEAGLRLPQGACESSTSSVCYDLADRRIVVRQAREYMPKLGDLTPESVSLRPNRIIVKYSFR
ncbi:MAG TPA: hypothetical protein VEG27_03480 [Usitatibacter sp.]|nr:hypothetical protein [Usitatibacter sp.]